MGIRRSVFDQLGGFDEDMARAEDVDLCWRLQHAGLKLGYQPAARVAYRHRGGVLGTLGQAYQFGRAGAALCRKHGRRRALGARFLDLARAAPGHLVRRGRRVDWLRKVSHDVGMLVGRLT
jgi:GT2 family glycosyltransferase